MNAVIVVCLMLIGPALCAGEPAERTFNAVDGVPHELMVAVGDHGLIVHFPAGEAPRQMPSGTDRDLLDVHVAASDFAVAVGPGIVLLWDGEAWAPVVTEEDVAPFAQAWASPNHQFFMYGLDESGAYRLCPRLKNVSRQPFCRKFPAALLAACGDGDLITLLLANGEIHRVNDALIRPDGSFEPVFRPHGLHRLRAAWFPDEGCDPRGGLPEMFAAGENGLMHFVDKAWRSLGERPLREGW
ncbi:MAG: hypothetical protein R3348_09220 [Xanthomonadales bacterium]|nr:hypothetical protein [Xanthomonadales bacterium]